MRHELFYISTLVHLYFNSNVPDIVPIFYYAIKHGYKIIIYFLIKKNEKLLVKDLPISTLCFMTWTCTVSNHN